MKPNTFRDYVYEHCEQLEAAEEMETAYIASTIKAEMEEAANICQCKQCDFFFPRSEMTGGFCDYCYNRMSIVEEYQEISNG